MSNTPTAGGSNMPATASSSTAPSVNSYSIRVPKDHNKKLAIMRFNNNLGIDFTKWSRAKMERENNQVQFKGFNEDMPKFGAGSEYGREAREEARRKKYGIISKKYKPEDQPWILQYEGKNGKKLRGVREGGVTENASYYMLTQASDGAFEAFPVKEWYHFNTVQNYKALSYEEAEEEFTSRNKTYNYFNVMVRKRMKKIDGDDGENEGDDEDGAGKSKGKKKKPKGDSRYGDDMDEMMDSSGESSDEDENEGDEDGKKANGKKKGKKAPPKRKRRNSNGGLEDSDDGDGEGRELDYISSSDAESDLDQAKDDLKGVAEEDGLRKLLNSDEDDEDDEEDENKDQEEEDDENGESKEDGKGSKDEKNEKMKKKKKKNKDSKKPRKEDYGSSSSSDSDGGSSASEIEKAKPSPKPKPGSANSSRSATPTKFAALTSETTSSDSKRKGGAAEGSFTQAAKKPRLDLASSSSATSSPATSSSSNEGVNEDSVRRYLQRKPMTTTELLQKFKSKKTGLSSDQLVHHIAQILKKINPVKQTIKGKMYLSIKNG